MATRQLRALPTVAAFVKITDEDYTCDPADRVVAQIGLMTAARTVTLPLAANVGPGEMITIYDLSGLVSTTRTLSIARAGSDTIDGSGTVPAILSVTYGALSLISDGVSAWVTVGSLRPGNDLTYDKALNALKLDTNIGGISIGLGVKPVAANLDVLGTVALRSSGAALGLASGNNNDVGSSSVSFRRVTANVLGSTITGLTGGVDGRLLILYNTANNLTIAHEDANSTAANRIRTMTGVSAITIGEGAFILVYDGTLSRWLVIGSST